MLLKRPFLQLFLIIAFSFGCKEKFDPPVIQKGLSALVVDGFLNNSADTTFIRLSRTTKLRDSVRNSSENGAQLFVEDANAIVVYSFQQLNDSGIYIVPGMGLNADNKYRLRIITSNGKQYISDEMTFIKTPPIDSISWEKNDKGVVIYANTHDPQNSTRYYRWEYTETWKYRSAYFSSFIFQNGMLRERTPDEYVYDCWKTQRSTELLLASSAKLSEDVIYHFPLRHIDKDAYELSEKYFIALKQYALNREAYEYMENLKKITDQTGSIFDAQPSEIKGNIHALNNPNEPVLGYILVSTVESKQLYITNDEVAPWYLIELCPVRKISGREISDVLSKQTLLVLYCESCLSPAVIYYVTDPICADCRLKGGTTTKPGFWP